MKDYFEGLVFIEDNKILEWKELGEYLVDTALEAIPDADVVVWVVDITQPPHPEDRLARPLCSFGAGQTTASAARRLPTQPPRRPAEWNRPWR